MNDNLTRPLEVTDVTIQTATIEVKVVRIGKRQLTLSVFKQLPCRHVLEMDRDAGDELWGQVNYFWDGCGWCPGDGDHLHVVWTGGGRLYRSCVGRLRMSDGTAYGDPAALAHVFNAEAFWANADGYHWLVLDDMLMTSEAREAVDEWNAFYDKLAALDQLFIAV